jgi:hypothetical protein
VYGRLVGFGVGASFAWVGAVALFGVYLNWFSETGRDGGWAILGFAWSTVLVAVGATVAFAATRVFAIADQVRSHA